MQPAYHIPLPNRGSTGSIRSAFQPAFSTPVRWTLCVLAWLAFGLAAYLAFFSINESSVAGCGVGDSNGCDVVLSSSWSKWIGVPVAALGLACYSILASLSILLGLRNEVASRWISTAFVMLSIVAAGASLWFIGVQVFAIGTFCKFCLATDACGIALGFTAAGAAAWTIFSRPRTPATRALPPGLIGMRSPAPVGVRTATPATRSISSPPSLAVALGGAVPLLALLIGGQMLFAAKTYDMQKVALSESINMVGSSPDKANDASATVTPRIAMRIPTEPDVNPKPADPGAEKNTASNNPADASPTHPATPAPNPAEPPRERLVKFLGGKLTLDVYKHPLIGSPDAPHIVVEMVSYDCPHCRKMYPIIEDALARYGDQVALLVMPVPLDKDCNKLITDPTITHRGACGAARMVIGLAKLDPSALGKFHDFLMSGGDKPPDMDRVIPKAYGLVNSDQLRELMNGPEVKKQLEGYVDLFGKLQAQSHGNKTFGLPVQILGDQVMSGSVEKPEDVFNAWEEHLGVKPK